MGNFAIEQETILDVYKTRKKWCWLHSTSTEQKQTWTTSNAAFTQTPLVSMSNKFADPLEAYDATKIWAYGSFTPFYPLRNNDENSTYIRVILLTLLKVKYGPNSTYERDPVKDWNTHFAKNPYLLV